MSKVEIEISDDRWFRGEWDFRPKDKQLFNGVYLDELDPNKGRIEDEIMQDCGIMCYLALN